VNLSNVSASFTSNYKGKIKVLDGSFPSASQALTDPQALAGESLPAGTDPAVSLPTTTVYSDYSLVHAANQNVKIKMSGKVNSTDFTDKIVSFQSTLAPGGSYTLKVTLRKGLLWAKSNIYWDGSKLTFQPCDSPEDPYNYQGVFFQWGSLVGISPVGAWSVSGANATPLYVSVYMSSSQTAMWLPPTNMSTAVGGSYPGFGGSATWESIPSLFGVIISGSDSDRGKPYLYNYSADKSSYSVMKGDICRYISDTDSDPALQGYRMPTSYEFDYSHSGGGTWAANPDWKQYNSTSWGSVTTTTDHTGRSTSITWGGQQFGATFPASGGRIPSGDLYEIGLTGRYWSGSAANNEFFSYGMMFLDAGTNITGDLFLAQADTRYFALPVRCIKN
jgi:hypothetical protein